MPVDSILSLSLLHNRPAQAIQTLIQLPQNQFGTDKIGPRIRPNLLRMPSNCCEPLISHQKAFSQHCVGQLCVDCSTGHAAEYDYTNLHRDSLPHIIFDLIWSNQVNCCELKWVWWPRSLLRQITHHLLTSSSSSFLADQTVCNGFLSNSSSLDDPCCLSHLR